MTTRSPQIKVTGIPWVFLIFLFLWGNPALGDARMNVFSTVGVDLHYEASLKNAAREAAEIYRQAKTELEAVLGWRYDVKPTVVLLKNSHEFRRLTGYSYFVALAIPPKNLIILDYSKMSNRPYALENTMKHEICHLMLHHHIRHSHLPKWLDEGIAQWVSGGMIELLLNAKRRSLDDAVLAGNYIPLGELSHRFPRERRLMWLAYEESKRMVAYIEKRYGTAALLDVLNRLKAGQDFETALVKSCGVSFDQLQNDWRHQLKKSSRILPFLAAYIYEVLFFLAALLTVAGFVRFLIKKRAYQDDDNDEPGGGLAA